MAAHSGRAAGLEVSSELSQGLSRFDHVSRRILEFQHLKVLKDAGLVADQADGTRRIYHLNEAGVLVLRDQLDTFWNRALSGYQELVESPKKEKKSRAR